MKKFERLKWLVVFGVILCVLYYGSFHWFPTSPSRKGYYLMTEMNESLIRCKATHLGCFVPFEKPIAKFRQTQLMTDSRVEMKRQCLEWCYSSGGEYAGLAMDSEACLCSTGIEGFISHTKSQQWAESRWRSSESCNASISYDIYRKTGNCEGNITKYVAEQLIGWTRITFGETPKGMLQLESSNVTSEQCILNCESNNYEFGIPYSRKKICYCSDFASLYTKNVFTTLGSSSPPSTMFSIPVYRTLNEDPACTVRFGNLTTGGPIALTSHPGSGNTWIRHLLELSTGVYTESVYKDMSLYNRGFLGQFTQKKLGKIIKDHLIHLHIRPQYKSAILLVRNPHDAILAERSRSTTQSHVGLPAVKVFRGKDFELFATDNVSNWMKRVTLALKHKWKLLLIYYENLRKNPVREMRRVAEFLQLNSTDHKENFEKRLICMQLDITGNFKRPRRKLDFNPFTEGLQKAINDAIKKVNTTLEELHYPTLPSSYSSMSSK